MGKTYLLMVDAHSKWPEIIEMSSTTTNKTITELRKMFAAYGLPAQLVSDNIMVHNLQQNSVQISCKSMGLNTSSELCFIQLPMVPLNG